MYKNSRKYRRYPIFATVEIFPKGKENPTMTNSMVDNISLYGIGLYSSAPYDTGAHVYLKLSFLNSYGSEEKDTIGGNVVWVLKKRGLYFMGISFDEGLNPSKQPHLYEYFYTLIKKWE